MTGNNGRDPVTIAKVITSSMEVPYNTDMLLFLAVWNHISGVTFQFPLIQDLLPWLSQLFNIKKAGSGTIQCTPVKTPEIISAFDRIELLEVSTLAASRSGSIVDAWPSIRRSLDDTVFQNFQRHGFRMSSKNGQPPFEFFKSWDMKNIEKYIANKNFNLVSGMQLADQAEAFLLFCINPSGRLIFNKQNYEFKPRLKKLICDLDSERYFNRSSIGTDYSDLNIIPYLISCAADGKGCISIDYSLIEEISQRRMHILELTLKNIGFEFALKNNILVCSFSGKMRNGKRIDCGGDPYAARAAALAAIYAGKEIRLDDPATLNWKHPGFCNYFQQV